MIVIRIPANPKKEKTQKLRVAAYCRVSSAESEQIASLESQVYYYLYADGYSIRKICNYLEDKGIKTKTGKTKWAPNGIGKMLLNAK